MVREEGVARLGGGEARMNFGRTRIVALAGTLSGTLASGAMMTAVAGTFFGCSADLGTNTPDDPSRPTMGGTITENDNVDDDVLTTASIGDDVSVSIRATPVFCCNPLALNFIAEFDEGAMPPGTIFEWDFGDGRSGTGRYPSHTYDFAGEYLVVLRALMPDGSEQTAEVRLTLGINDDGGTDISIEPDPFDDDVGPPDDDTGGGFSKEVIARAGENQIVEAGDVVVLDARGSEGNGSGALAFRWAQRSGPAIFLSRKDVATTSFVAPPDVEADVTLWFLVTVTQGGVTDSDDMAVTVQPAPKIAVEPPPEATVTADAGDDQAVDGGMLVILSGAASRGTGADPLAYSWVQTEGPAVSLTSTSGSTTGFVAPAPTEPVVELVFQLSVTQGTALGTDTVTVTVVGPAFSAQPDHAQLVEWLGELDPLPKVHYSFPIESSLLHVPVDPLLYEYVRITHAASITGRGPRQHHVDAAVAACELVNRDNPTIPASIALNFSPWMDVFPADAPPTDFGPLHDAELAAFHETLLQFRDWLAESNAARQTDVPISALLLDHERFKVSDDDPVWNQAITDKLTATYDTAKSVFPDARIEWWGRGGHRPIPSGWGRTPYSTLEEPGESFACSLYRVPEAETTRETYRRTYALALAHGVSQVNPWVALAAGVRPHPTTFSEWLQDWDYDTSHAWRIGAELNDPFHAANPDVYAPWDAAEVITFYPGAFNHRSPAWGKHFVAYVRGAHGIEELP